MRLEIDWTRCDGHGLCAQLLPELVSLDEDGFPVLHGREVDGALLPHARRTVGACPRLALRLEEAPRPVAAARARPTASSGRARS
jgi:ferredoxin